MKILPLFKSHYSLGRSILTLEKPEKEKKKYQNSIFDLVLGKKLDTVVLVEDNISGLLQASQNAKDSKLKLVFGLRLNVTQDALKQDEDSLKKRAKYIIFAKNPEGYKALLRIWSFAAQQGFYYTPAIDFKHLHDLWTKDLMLALPFYDSFVYLNTFIGHQHIPDLNFGKAVFLLEDNNLPFDDLLRVKVEKFAADNKHDTIEAQSIFYPGQEDFTAYVTFRCIHNRHTAQKSTLEKPELKHMGADTFNFNRWVTRAYGS